MFKKILLNIFRGPIFADCSVLNFSRGHIFANLAKIREIHKKSISLR